MCKLVCANWYVQTGMCKLVCANWYVQTMCKLVCANWSCKLVVQNDIFACNFLNNGPILIIFFCLKAPDLLFQLHKRLCNSTSAHGAARALVECYVQTALCKLLCANCYVQTGRANWSCKRRANWSCKLVGMEACDRVWGHVAWVVTGCGGMWQGSGYVIGGQA